jgi:dihydrofolate reductase
MRKMILYIAASLDSYIARRDGSIDWLKPYDFGEEDYGYNAFYAGVDTLLLGRNTYTQMLSFGAWPYAEKKCYVFSREPIDDPRVSALGDPVPAARKMKEEPGKDIWLVGGSMAVSLMVNARLVDELRAPFKMRRQAGRPSLRRLQRVRSAVCPLGT